MKPDIGVREAAPESEVAPLAGRYVYCVALGGDAVSLSESGIAGREVYAVAYRDICAIVHDCLAVPYESADPAVVGEWIVAHHQVVDAAWRRWRSVLPMTFNSIVGATHGDAAASLLTWLEAEYASLRERLEALVGKAEYGVQVFWDAAVAAQQVATTSPEIANLKAEIDGQPRGLAYMYRQRLEGLLKSEVEARAAAAFEDVYGRIAASAAGVRVEKTKRVDGDRQMLANLSCLVAAGRVAELEATLDALGRVEGLSVRLAGPLPPYSFC